MRTEQMRSLPKTRPSSRLRLALSCMVLASTMLIVCKAYGQAAYDVVAIHEVQPGRSYTMTVDDPPHRSTFTVAMNTVEDLIQIAYGMRADQIQGLPSWAATARFNLSAKGDTEVDQELKSLGDAAASDLKRSMLQALLRDRFGLKVHAGERLQQGSMLTAPDGADKLPPAGSLVISPLERERFGEEVPHLYQASAAKGQYTYVAHGASMADLAEQLAQLTGRPFVDRTGLSGRFDFSLRFRLSDVDSDTGSDEAAEPLQSALKRLGLRVHSEQVRSSVLIVDAVRRPTEN